MPEALTTVSEVLRKQLQKVEHVTDADVSATCAMCNAKQTFAEAAVTHAGAETVYVCRNVCGPLLIIADAGVEGPWAGRGYRLGPYVLRNAVDLFINVNATASVKIPASVNAVATN